MKFNNYNFQGPFSNVEEIRDEAGIYVVLSLCPDSLPVVLDVGESGWNQPQGQGIKRRLRGHKRRHCWEEHRGDGKIAFSVLYVPDGSRRLEIEKELRLFYHPPCGTDPPSWQ